MEVLVKSLQSGVLDIKDGGVRSALLILQGLLAGSQSEFSDEEEAGLIELIHAVICKTAPASGGDPLLRGLHASAVAFALLGLERSVKTESIVDDTSSQNPLAFLELLEAATIKDKAEEQSADALAALSKYDEQQLPFSGASKLQAPASTSGAAASDTTIGPSLVSALLSTDHLRSKSIQATSRADHWLPLAKDLPSATLYHAILYERLITRVLAVCDALLQPLVHSTSQAEGDSWQAIRKPLSLISQLLPFLEEVLLLQAPLHIFREVEPCLFSIASRLGPVYEMMLERGKSSAAEAGEESPGELLLVNELLGVAETARVNPVVLVNLKTLLAATLVETVGKLELPDVESLLEPSSTFSDAHESLPNSGEEHFAAGTALPDFAPSFISLALQLIQEVDQELNPFETPADSEQVAVNESQTTPSAAAGEGLIRSGQLWEGFDWRRQHSREHLLSLILPPAGKWLDNFVAMLLLSPDQDGYATAEETEHEDSANDGDLVLSKAPSAKSAPLSKDDNLFGDLFQEAIGSRLSEASHRESPLESASHSSAKQAHLGGWAETAVQVAQFLGGCAFDGLWCPKVLEASCALLKKEHIAAIIASYVLAGGVGAGGFGASNLGSALHRLVEALTAQDSGLAKSPGLVQELAVQLYSQGSKASGLLSILVEWVARKASDVRDGEAGQALADSKGERDEATVAVELRGLVDMLWDVVFQTLASLTGAAEGEPGVSSDLEPLEHALGLLPNEAQIAVLLLGFHLLRPADRLDLLRTAVGQLSSALSSSHLMLHTQPLPDGESTSRAVQQLAVSRLVLLVGSLFSQDPSMPNWLLGRVQKLRDAASFQLVPLSSKAEHLSFTASVAQHVSSSSSGHFVDEALLQSLFLLGGNSAAQPGPLDEAEQALASSFLRLLLPVLALPGRQFGSCTEVLIESYLAEVCWRALWLWPLPDGGPANRALRIAQLLDAAGLAPRTAPRGLPDAGLLDAAWADIIEAPREADTCWESEPLLFSTLAVVTAGLQEVQKESGKLSEAASPQAKNRAQFAVSSWLRSKGAGALSGDLCTLLARAVSRYDELLQSNLEKCYGAEVAQTVILLLRARISDRNKYEGVLLAAGVSPAAVQQLLLGGLRLLGSLQSVPLEGEDGRRESFKSTDSGFPPRWEAALLLPGLPSTAETSSSAVASCQILITAVLGCIDALLSVEDCDGDEWAVLEETLGHATRSGLIDTEGPLLDRIQGRRSSRDTEKKGLVELGHSVKLCQGLLQQCSSSPEDESASTSASPSQTGKNLENLLEAVLLDVADKIEALLNEPSGRGLKVLLSFLSHDSDEGTEAASSSAELVHEHSSMVSRQGGDLTFLLTALLGSPSIALNGKILVLLLKLVSCETRGLRLETSQTEPALSGEETEHLRGLLGQTVACQLRRGLLQLGDSGLSTWLRERLLGSTGGSLTWKVPTQQRSSARSLIEALVEPAHGSVSDFRSQVVQALLPNLKLAYTTFEGNSVDAYFELIVHLSADHASLLQLVLEVILDLLDSSSLRGDEQLGHVRKLLSFLGAVFSSAVAIPASQQEALLRQDRTGRGEQRERSASRNRAPQMHGAIAEGKEDEPGKEQSDLDEEEEDLISFGEDDEEDEAYENEDGETVEMDEEDGFESGESTSDDEDAKLCTFGASGSNFIEQHWYFCYTCELTVSKGCCSTCARVCHKDHKVVYSKFSRFFCDCGAGGSRTNPCQSLRPRAPQSDTSSIRASSRGPVPAESASDSGSDVWFEPQGVLQTQVFPKLRADAGVLTHLEEKGLEKTLIKLCDEFANTLGLDSADLGAEEESEGFDFEVAGGVKQRSDILSFARAHKYGTFEMRLKMEYSSAREIRAALATGAIQKSLLSASKRGKVAVGEGDKVTIFEAALLIAATGEKGAPKPLSKNAVRFQVLNVEFNPANDAHLVVSGYEDCQVFILNPRGEVTDRLAVELALESETFLVQASWVPGSQVELLVVSNRWAKIYDLSKDKISPLYYVRVPQESIKQAVLAKVDGDALCIVLLTQQGVLFTGRLTPQEGQQGPITLSQQLQLPPDRQWPGSRGCSLSYFSEHRTLVASYEDGQVVIGQLSEGLQRFERACFLSQEERSGNLHHWRAVSETSGVFVAANSSRQGGAVAVQLGKGTVEMQPLRQIGAPSTLKMEGVAVCGSEEKCSVLVLNDDGSLQVFAHTASRTREALNPPLSSRVAYLERNPVQQSTAAPSFPLSFFENTTCITQSVSWGGDLGDSDAIKLSLAADESFLEAPNARAFRIVVNNAGLESVMVGCRVHVGTTGRANVPSRLQVFDRTIVLEEGVRRWYDIPFTVIESLTADRSFTLSVDPAPGNQLARIDAIEVYARSKDDFGWREKVESMRDLLQQNRALPGGPGAAAVEVSGAPRDASPGQPPLSPAEEGLCAGLEVLALFCSWAATGAPPHPLKPLSSPRPTGHEDFVDAVEEQSEAMEEPAVISKPDRPVSLAPTSCLPLLEKLISTSDPSPSVQSFAQRVLASLYPNPNEAQKAKDQLLLNKFTEVVGVCARTFAHGSRHAQARSARIFEQRLHWASEIAAKRPEHFTEAVSYQGVATFLGELLSCFEGIAGKGHVSMDELSTLTTDLVEVFCGLTQVVETTEGYSAERPGSSQLVQTEESLSTAQVASSEEQGEGALRSNQAASEGTSVGGRSDAVGGAAPLKKPSSTGQSQTHFDLIISALRSLLVSPLEPVRSAAGGALAAYLLQSKLATSATPLQPLVDSGTQEEPRSAIGVLPQALDGDSAVQFSCDGCSVCPIVRRRWHCTRCPDFDLCEKCYEERAHRHYEHHLPEHRMVSLPVEDAFAAFPNPHNVAEALAHAASDSGEDSDESIPETPAPQQLQESASNGMQSSSGPALEVEDMSEDALLRLALELSMQEAQPQVAGGGPQEGRAALEAPPSTEGETPERANQRPERGVGLEAATTSAEDDTLEDPLGTNFRSALLASFAEDVSWMPQCSGLEAVPLMQLLAQLASAGATGGAPGVDGFDLCKLVRNLLREIDLGVALPLESRSKWGEVALLTLKFFAFVMNDWEGTDEGLSIARDRKKGPGSGATSAKDELRQHALLDYLLSILQRLVPEFAKHKREKCGAPGNEHQGALLHVRHDKTVSSLCPFFPDSYTRAHGRDVFAEFQKLLLGVALDLAEGLTESGVKMEASGGSEEAAEGSWVDVLCSYIYCPQTHFIRDSARHVLLQACGGSRSSYNLARDSWLLRKELQQLQKLADKSDAFQLPLSHERSVKLIKCLGVLAETAEKRPDSWQWFCSSEKHSDAFPFLLRSSFFFGEEAAVRALKLLSLAFADGKKEDAQLRTRPSASLLLKDPAELERFVRFFLLDFGAKAVRVQARALLQNAWPRAERDDQRSLLLGCLVSTIPQLASYGANLHEASGLLKWILGKDDAKALLAASGLSSALLEALRTQNRVLETHPYARAYSMLQALIEFDGYYLESESCAACNSLEAPYSKLKLESIKQETKYTDNRLLVRCASSYTLESFTMNVHDARRSKSVKLLRLYYNNRTAADLSELKSNWGLWKKVKSYHLAPNQAELKADLTAPVTGCNFMFEFAELHENLQASSLEHLQCPRCSRHVTDKHGICPHCHENCFQCRQCRNINYENLDSFLCNECGYSKYGRFEFSVNAKPSFVFDAIESDDDMQKCLAVIEKESENAHKQYQLLTATKKPLLRLLSTIGEGSGDLETAQAAHQVAVPSSTPATLKVNQSVAVLGVLYGNKCKEAFEQVSRSVQTLHGARKALTAFLGRSSSKSATSHEETRPRAPERPASHCYGCASTFVNHALEWLHLSAGVPEAKQKMVEAGLMVELFESGIRHGSQQVRASTRSLICTLVRDNRAASETLTQLIRQRILYCLGHPRNTELAVQAKDDCLLLRDAVALNDSLWEPRLKLTFELLFRGVEVGTDSPPIAENVILPCLRIVAQACQVPQASRALEAVKSRETLAADPSPTATHRIGGLSQAFASRAQERLSFAEVASGATRGTPGVAPQPSRPPPVRPTPLIVPAQSVPEKGAPVVTYKQWASEAVTFDDYVQQHHKIKVPAEEPPKTDARSQARNALSAAVPRTRPETLARKVLGRWRSIQQRRQLGVLDKESWLKGLLLSRSSPTIRTEACVLVRTLATSGGQARKLRFLDLTTELLTSARDAGADACVEYLDLYKALLADDDARLYLAAKGWLKNACALIVREVHRIRAQEGNYLLANVNEGFVLQHLIAFLSSFLEIRTIKQRFVKDGLLASVLEALLCLKSLVIQKTQLTTRCAQELSSLLAKLLETGEDTQRSFVRACMSALEEHTGKDGDVSGGQRAATFIMNQVCDVIRPARPEPVYLLTLTKAHTQEEFIRGSMAQNPYSSAHVGPLMRDVKNKICTQLEMLGLIEDDYGMELLVAGSIVSLDLSIKQVYEKVWLRTQQAVGVQSLADCPPMTVTYRLQGLDGEATEPMISEVDDDRGEQQDPEVEFALTGEMESCGGLQLLLKLLRQNPPGAGELGALLKLLGFCCKVRTNRRTLLSLDALHVSLERARAAVSVSSTEQDGTAEALLEIIESLVTEANDIAAGEGDVTPSAAGKESVSALGRSWAGESREQDAVAAVKMFLDKLSHRPHPVQGGKNAPESKGGKQSQADAVARILPYLTYGEPAAMECLIGHFTPFLDFQNFDSLCAQDSSGEAKQQALDHRQRLESFVKVCESIRLDANGDLLKTLFLERGLVALAVHYLKGAFPLVTSAGAQALEIRSAPEFTQALLLPGVPIVLGMLTGLANGQVAIQGLLDREGLLPLLHALEGVSSEQKEIRAKAEGLLDIFSEEASGGSLAASVNALRQATKDELRVRAMKRREAMLKGLGMASAVTSDGADRITVNTKPKIEGLDDVEEEGEDSLSCMVCREGYKLKPTECLGTYTFSKRVNAGPMLGARSEHIYTTVSHFNVIHFTCHAEAKRADSKLKAPKKEWEGAALRNSETLTNSIFPLRGPAVSSQNYSRYCDQYWENLSQLGRSDGSRFKLLAYDLALLLGRFASGGSFSADSHGGGKESNSQLLPFMVQMGAYLLEQVGSTQRRALRKSLQAYLGVSELSRTPGAGTPGGGSRRGSFADGTSTAPAADLASTPGGSSLPPRSPAPAVGRSLDESIHLMLVLSLLMHSLEEWHKHRREFLQRALHFAYNQAKQSRPLVPVPPSPSPGSSLTDLSSLLMEGPLLGGDFDPQAAFKTVKPLAIMVALVHKLQTFLKKAGASVNMGLRIPGSPAKLNEEEELSFSFPRPETPGREASPRRSDPQKSPLRRSGGDDWDQSWELVMKERLRDIPAMLTFAREFQETVEELHAAEDLMELLDVVDCLSDVYPPGGGGSWQEFLEHSVRGMTPWASLRS